MAFNHVAEKNG